MNKSSHKYLQASQNEGHLSMMQMFPLKTSMANTKTKLKNRIE